jgi:hypothetical protein
MKQIDMVDSVKFLQNDDVNILNTIKSNETIKKETVLPSKDGLVERINKKYITDDGKQLLTD